jgi:hypothetical protein
MLMAFFMFAKLWKFTRKKKPLVTSLIFILNFKKIDKVYDDIKDQT